MKRLILIFIFVSGINLFAKANFYLEIYEGKANYLDGYNQYLPANYYIFNYELKISIGENKDDVTELFGTIWDIKRIAHKTNYIYQKQYLYDYTNKKMYLLRDYYRHEYEDLKHYGGGLADGFLKILDKKIKYYDLNGKQMQTSYEFAYITISEPNRFGEITTNKTYHNDNNNLFYSVFDFYNYSYLNKVYKNSLKQPNIIDTKNIGLYINYDFSIEDILTLGSEYHDYNSIKNESYYEYSGKDYIFLINEGRDTYYIIDLETKSKVKINLTNAVSKEEYEKELNKETEKIKNQITEKEQNISELQSELSYAMQVIDNFINNDKDDWNNDKDSWIKDRITFYMKKPYKKKRAEATAMATAEWEEKVSSYQINIDNLKKEIEKLENEIKELEKSIEELENIYKNRKNSELENKYIKIFREKLPELEDEYYYLGENSISTNSINFIPFKYLKPYFEESVKTKEQFYKLINFENEK